MIGMIKIFIVLRRTIKTGCNICILVRVFMNSSYAISPVPAMLCLNFDFIIERKFLLKCLKIITWLDGFLKTLTLKMLENKSLLSRLNYCLFLLTI